MKKVAAYTLFAAEVGLMVLVYIIFDHSGLAVGIARAAINIFR